MSYTTAELQEIQVVYTNDCIDPNHSYTGAEFKTIFTSCYELIVKLATFATGVLKANEDLAILVTDLKSEHESDVSTMQYVNNSLKEGNIQLHSNYDELKKRFETKDHPKIEQLEEELIHQRRVVNALLTCLEENTNNE